MATVSGVGANAVQSAYNSMSDLSGDSWRPRAAANCCGTLPGAARHAASEQSALSTEALDQRRGNDSSLLSNIGQGELRWTAPLHDAARGGENLSVRSFARAGAHFVFL